MARTPDNVQSALVCPFAQLHLLTHLNKGDLNPVVGLDVQHLDPVASDGEAAVILGDVPGDVDLVSHAVLVRPSPGGQLDCGLPRGERNSWSGKYNERESITKVS